MSLFLSRDEFSASRTDMCLLDPGQLAVYVLSCGYRETPETYAMCKVGMSKNPWARASHQRSLLGINKYVNVELVVPCRDPEAVEARAHAILADKLIRREWFNCSIEEAEAAVLEAAR